jgi:predicted amidohydrolase
MKVALCQTTVYKDKKKNIRNAEHMIAEAAKAHADMVVLPEMFVCPYNKRAINGAAEPAGAEVWQSMSAAAKQNRVYLVAGSIPERENGNIYSTAFVFDREGRQIGRYRKLHLFDIAIRDAVVYRESDIVDPGSEVTVVDTEFGPIGIAICYDVRFPEQFRLMAKRGVKAVMIPASFNPTTGPAHWELLMRARAIDQECYVLGCASASDLAITYSGWGHSIAVSPWGEIMDELGQAPGILMATLDFDYVNRIRQEIPVLSQLRTDIYEVREKFEDNGKSL